MDMGFKSIKKRGDDVKAAPSPVFPKECVHWQVREPLGSLREVALGRAEGTATPVYDFQ